MAMNDLEKISIAAAKLKTLCNMSIDPANNPEWQNVLYIMLDYIQEIQSIANSFDFHV